MSDEPRWWVGINDRPEGPWTAAEIASALNTKRISFNSLVCAVGGDRWQPLRDFPELNPKPPQRQANETVVSRPPIAELVANPYSSPSELALPTATTWKWPSMKTVVTNYCLYGMTIYQGLSVLCLLFFGIGSVEGMPDYWMTFVIAAIQFPARTALLLLFLMAGLNWQKNDGKAARWTQRAIYVDFGFIASILLVVISCGPYVELLTPPELVPQSEWLGRVALFLGFLLLAWEIWILVWLHQQRDKLFAPLAEELK